MLNVKSITNQQQNFYNENGYLIGLHPVYSADEMRTMNEQLSQLAQLLKQDEKLQHIREWHMSSRWLYDICTHPQILSYVEGIIGPNFYLWGSQFFAKQPNSKDIVAWHQDSYYWPLSPHHSVTVWLAFTDVDEENGAMKVIPRTHKAGLIRHRRTSGDSVLALELEEGTFNESDAVSLILQAGQISLHDDAIVHGSPANPSNRWRTGLTIRYSATDVKCDLSKAPTFRAYPVRGIDQFQYNPQGIIPIEKFGRLPSEDHISSTDEV